MTIYRLYYVYANNGESGACSTFHIAETADKAAVEKIIKDNNLTVVTDLQRGQHHVFVFDWYNPMIPEYIDKDSLKLALKEDAEYKEEGKRTDELMGSFDWWRP